MKTHKGDFYFPSRKIAQEWANQHGWPIAFIREFRKGFAVQACNSGQYAGPDQMTWPGPEWWNLK